MVYLCAEDLHLRESFARGDLPSKQAVTDLLTEIFSTTPVITPTGAVIESNLYQQSSRFDIKSTVLNNIYAQLELSFGLLRATTPKYNSYQYIAQGSTQKDTSPAATAVRKHSKKAVKWTNIDVEAAAKSSGLHRNDIVDKLQHWNDTRLIELKTGGVVNVFRIMKALPQTAQEKRSIAETLYRELVVREQQELARMQSVIDLICGSACIARTLAEHFGDSLPDGKQECGHCTWCETKKPVERVTRPTQDWDPKAFNDVLAACPARDDPRFLARVAFGIGSPRATGDKLSKNKVFGSMEDHDFVVRTEYACHDENLD